MDGTGVAAAGIISTAFVGSLAIEFGYISGRADRLRGAETMFTPADQPNSRG